MMAKSLIPLLILMLYAVVGAEGDESGETRCSENGPPIRFPFWLKGHHPAQCGHPNPHFVLSCSPKSNATVLELPPANLLVEEIDYDSMEILVMNPSRECLCKQFLDLNLSASPFEIISPQSCTFFNNYYYYERTFFDHEICHSSIRKKKKYGLTLFRCSQNKDTRPGMFPIVCLGGSGYYGYAVDSRSLIIDFPLDSCTKMYSINYSASEIIFFFFNNLNNARFSWSDTICENCTALGQSCILTNNASQCIPYYSPPDYYIPNSHEGSSHKTKVLKKLVLAGKILGLLSILIAILALFLLIRSTKLKRRDQLKIEKFLADYRALQPSRYSYSDIKKITNQFRYKLGQGGYGKVYKGNLSNDVAVAVKVLNDSTENGGDFINEVATIGRIHHINVVRLVGYCADGSTRALIYEFLPNDSLQKFISWKKQNRSTDWEMLQRIALGIAKGIQYLHQGCDKRILHFDIKPHNILLDENFTPKIADFGLAKLCSKDRSTVSMTAPKGTIGYIAPEVFSRNYGNVSYKSDVYSFGMLLIEMVGGKRMVDSVEEESSQAYYPEWIYNHLAQGEELVIQIERADDAKIAKKLTIVGLWCIQWFPVDRPSMKAVIQMLEGGDIPSMPPNPFGYTKHERAFNRELEVILESG